VLLLLLLLLIVIELEQPLVRNVAVGEEGAMRAGRAACCHGQQYSAPARGSSKRVMLTVGAPVAGGDGDERMK
jgi:hypothetical protein